MNTAHPSLHNHAYSETHKTHSEKILICPTERFIQEFVKKWRVDQPHATPAVALRDFELKPWGKAAVLVAHHCQQTRISAVNVHMTPQGWNRAIKTAEKLLAYANRSIIVMPSSAIHAPGSALENKQAFEDKNVGLWEMTAKGVIIRHTQGVTDRPIHPTAHIQALRGIQAALKKTEASV